jgi:hypothetical protein
MGPGKILRFFALALLATLALRAAFASTLLRAAAAKCQWLR